MENAVDKNDDLPLATETQQACLGLDDDPDFEKILENMDQVQDDPKAWPQTLADLMAVIESQLSRKKRGDNDVLARDIAAAIAHYLGGRQVYLPRDTRLQNALRNREIYKEFNGSNQEELANKYELTIFQIYNIIAQQRKLHRDRVQHSLPL